MLFISVTFAVLNDVGRVSEVRARMPLNMLRIFVTFAVLNDVGRVSEVRACMS